MLSTACGEMLWNTGWQRSTVARPSVLVEVGVLDTPLHAALLALVNLVPEADGAFADIPRVSRAIGPGRRRTRSSGRKLGAAAGVVGKLRTVAADAGGPNRPGGLGFRIDNADWSGPACRCSRQRHRNCRLRQCHTLIARVGRAAGVLATHIFMKYEGRRNIWFVALFSEARTGGSKMALPRNFHPRLHPG
jgi:hypothetical protein